jgi:uncharacterized protein YbjQ (UPF0145 family)
MLVRLAAVLALVFGTVACAHADDIGKDVGSSLFGGIKVYEGNITKKYKVIRKVEFQIKQRGGAAYFDDNTVIANLRNQAKELGADAVIHFKSYFNRGSSSLGFLTGDLGYVGGSGIAVKFKK